MRPMFRLNRVALLLLSSVMLIACGQKGALYLPAKGSASEGSIEAPVNEALKSSEVEAVNDASDSASDPDTSQTPKNLEQTQN